MASGEYSKSKTLFLFSYVTKVKIHRQCSIKTEWLFDNSQDFKVGLNSQK